PAKRDVHCGIETPEAFAAFGRPPDDCQPGARKNALDEIIRPGREPDVLEAFELEMLAAVVTIALASSRRAGVAIALDLVENVFPPWLGHDRLSLLARRCLRMASRCSALWVSSQRLKRSWSPCLTRNSAALSVAIGTSPGGRLLSSRHARSSATSSSMSSRRRSRCGSAASRRCFSSARRQR